MLFGDMKASRCGVASIHVQNMTLQGCRSQSGQSGHGLTAKMGVAGSGELATYQLNLTRGGCH